MLRDISRTLRQLHDRRFLKVLLVSLVMTAMLFAILVGALGAVMFNTTIFAGWVWAEGLMDALGVVLAVVVAVLLFPGFSSMVQGLFLEDVALAVDERWYPDQPEPRPQSWWELIVSTAKLTGLIIGLNLLLLPLYLILLFFPPFNLILFYIVNGYLLGREYFEVVALRRMSPGPARDLRRRLRMPVWLAGAAIAFLFSIPILNLAAPVLGAALMLHLYQRLAPPAAVGMPDRPKETRPSALTGLLLAAMIGSGTMFGLWQNDLVDGPEAVAARIERMVLPQPGESSIAMPASAGMGPGGVPAHHDSVEAIGVALGPDRVVGRAQSDIAKQLGSPFFARGDGDARVWQYRTAGCVVDLYFYPRRGAFRVTHLGTRSRDGQPSEAERCRTRLVRAALSMRPSGGVAWAGNWP